MISKALLVSVLLLVFAKFFLRLRFRELGRRVDRAVNLVLVLLAVTYGAQLGYWLVVGR